MVFMRACLSGIQVIKRNNVQQVEAAVIGTGWCGGIRAETLSRSALVDKLHICEIRPDRLAEVKALTKPATAALLARARGNGKPYVSLLGSPKHTFFTDGCRELFDCAGQGRIDVFFLSGGEIDGEGNVNLVSIGDPDKPIARFTGSFGSSYLYFVVPKVILFRTEHSRRTLVPKVSFISAPGGSDDNVYRTGGPVALITNRCLFSFDQDSRRFHLERVHPGHTLAEVIVNTGFEFDRPPDVPITSAPSAETLRLLRQVVAPELAEV